MRILFGIFFITIFFVSQFACSPVKFAQNKNVCTVDNPCAGADGLNHVFQEFAFTASNKVDILVIVDNSGSMSVEQQNLASPFNGFISRLNSSGLDWQIGVTSTDVCPETAPEGFCPSGLNGARGRFMGAPGSNPAFGNQYIIKPGSNAQQLFAQRVQRGSEVGSGDERGIFAANLAVDQRNSANAGFFRDNSNLAVVILSDEDERSVNAADSSLGGYAQLANYDIPETFISKVAQTWNNTKSLLVNAIIIKPGDTTMYPDPNANSAPGGPYPQNNTCLNVQAHQPQYYTAHAGTAYARLAQKTGGVVGSICDNGSGSFAAMLNNITGAIINQPSSRIITLAHTPEYRPTVTFNPNGNTVGWSWVPGSNQIHLTSRPAAGTTVRVEYDYDPKTQKAFVGTYYSPDEQQQNLTGFNTGEFGIEKSDMPQEAQDF